MSHFGRRFASEIWQEILRQYRIRAIICPTSGYKQEIWKTWSWVLRNGSYSFCGDWTWISGEADKVSARLTCANILMHWGRWDWPCLMFHQTVAVDDKLLQLQLKLFALQNMRCFNREAADQHRQQEFSEQDVSHYVDIAAHTGLCYSNLWCISFALCGL